MRFHVHLHVDELVRSVDFYTKLFGSEPVRLETDYAKWMLDDPPVNFAISTRGAGKGIDHLGIQAADAQELATLKARAKTATEALQDDGTASCCYAVSEKHWVTDPQGVAWEHFHTLDSIPIFGHEGPPQTAARSACCTGSSAAGDAQPAAAKRPSSCC